MRDFGFGGMSSQYLTRGMEIHPSLPYVVYNHTKFHDIQNKDHSWVDARYAHPFEFQFVGIFMPQIWDGQ